MKSWDGFGRFRMATMRFEGKVGTAEQYVYHARDKEEEHDPVKSMFLVNLPVDWTLKQMREMFGEDVQVVDRKERSKNSYSGLPLLPALYIKSNGFGETGGRTHISFKDKSALQKALETEIHLMPRAAERADKTDKIRGYQRYLLNHASSTPDAERIREHSSSWLEKFDSLANMPLLRPLLGFAAPLGSPLVPPALKERLEQGRIDLITPADLRRFHLASVEAAKREQMEADGFTIVGADPQGQEKMSKNERRKGVTKDPAAKAQVGFVAGGAAGRGTAVVRAARRDMMTAGLDEQDGRPPKRKRTKSQGLEDFYRFQVRQGRRSDLEDMRKLFAQDKAMIAARKG